MVIVVSLCYASSLLCDCILSTITTLCCSYSLLRCSVIVERIELTCARAHVVERIELTCARAHVVERIELTCARAHVSETRERAKQKEVIVVSCGDCRESHCRESRVFKRE